GRDDRVVAEGGRRLRLPGEPAPRRGAAGQDRGHHLDGYVAVQRRLVRLEDDAHAPLTDDLLHLVDAERAEQFRAVGGAQEVQVGRLHGDGPGGGLAFAEPFQDLRQRRVGGGGRRVTD